MARRLRRAIATQTLTVANGGTTSDACDGTDTAIFGMILPAALTSVAATFTVCDTQSGTFVPLYDSTGTIVANTTVGTNRYIDLPTALAGAPFFKVVLGSAEGAARSIVIVKKG